jgi:hypothetical protein
LNDTSQDRGPFVTLTATFFEPHVRSDVTVYLYDGTPFVLTLTRVSPEGALPSQDPQTDSPGNSAFDMTLEAPTYSAVFPQAEPMHLFVRPIIRTRPRRCTTSSWHKAS